MLSLSISNVIENNNTDNDNSNDIDNNNTTDHDDDISIKNANNIHNNSNTIKEVWTTGSSTHAFPNVSMRTYQESIMESFLNAEAGVASGIVNGLSNPAIIDELISIWEGKLMIELKNNDEEEFDNGVK